MSTLPQLRVSLFGGFSLTVDNQLQTAVNQPQQQSLLAYLILQTPTPQLRRIIAFHFWPDSSKTRAFANLRGALHKLRHDCPAIDHYLLGTNTTLGWQWPSTFHLDVQEYENCLTLAHQATDQTQLHHLLEQAVTTYQGDLLPGCYDEWILPVRERLNQSFLQALQQLVDLLAEAGEYELAVPYAHQLRGSDPFREQSYQQLMTLHEARGDRAAALRVYHDCVTMLEQELGVSPGPETQVIYHRLLNRTTPLIPATPLPVATGDKVIGRQAEWQTLQAAWLKASQGRPHFVLIQGEAGIGKTHLAEALLVWARQHGRLTVQTRAYAAEGQLTYSPVIEWLRSPAYAHLFASLEDIWLTECARLLPELLVARPDLSAPPPVSESWQRQRLFEALARAALAPPPLLVLFDDLQWADKETLEWLHFLLRFDASAPLLLVGTVRMSEITANHPLTSLQQELHRDGRIQEIALAPLPATASDELAQQIVGSQLSDEILANLHHYAEGVPLFLVEAIRAEMDKAEAERWHWSIDTSLPILNALPLPPKVYAVIQARLNQLSTGAQQLAKVAAVIGRSFSLELLTLASHSDEESLIKNLDELWQRRIIREQGSYYDLNHDRIRDVVYAEIPPMQRKRLHRHVAEALTVRHGTNLDDVSAELARHYRAAGLISQAVGYYLQACKVAQQIYANNRAYDLASEGLALVKQLPMSAERDWQELSLYLILASAVRVLEGWASTKLYQIVNQAWDLSHKVDNPEPRFRLSKALFSYHIVRGDLDQAQHLGEQLLAISIQEQTPLFLVIAYNCLAGINFHRGQYQMAYELFEKSLVYYTPQQHKEHIFFDGADYGILSLGWQSHSLWCLGYPDQALKQCLKAVNLSEVFAHPASQVMALVYLGILYQLRQETEEARMCGESCLSLVSHHTIGYYQEVASILRTWSLVCTNPDLDRVNDFRVALNQFRAIGGGIRWNYYFSLLAELYGRIGELQTGLKTLDKAFAVVAGNGEHWWDAEMYRLRGNLLLLQSNDSLAEADYQQAINLARDKAALSLEMRAAISLARLWQGQGRVMEAYELLSAVYNQFTEGFDTPDLKDAQALLADLTN
jgi:DNA-binding SARP family transcriptional activator/predicted ATPase